MLDEFELPAVAVVVADAVIQGGRQKFKKKNRNRSMKIASVEIACVIWENKIDRGKNIITIIFLNLWTQ